MELAFTQQTDETNEVTLNAVAELTDMQLVLVGGGSADVILA